MLRKNNAVVVVPVVVYGLIALGFICFWGSLYLIDTLEKQDFHVSYIGVVDGLANGRGMFFPCKQFNDGPLYTTISLQGTASITVPVDITPGVYSFSNSDAEDQVQISVTVYDERTDSNLYFYPSTLVSGKLELDDLPYEPYEPVRGSFKAKFHSGYGLLDIEGNFDFKASGDFWSECSP